MNLKGVLLLSTPLYVHLATSCRRTFLLVALFLNGVQSLFGEAREIPLGDNNAVDIVYEHASAPFEVTGAVREQNEAPHLSARGKWSNLNSTIFTSLPMAVGHTRL
ncbi:hypothetical protein CYMTET_19053 [Cymbomonas tetramitiformis]|uniref:Uncharacterized protein n=1 Tax=Cymbomonas tetramitiformis TaxID=36881 RepID=A0AAE0G057_9CHLO|nr:hypothetical protein CYMTET_22472 [Cymbomonas tetramitiformis]KAK3272662.1 hypothetical protein CYMTET_19053 [Cymbomonas tetramitiformis]